MVFPRAFKSHKSLTTTGYTKSKENESYLKGGICSAGLSVVHWKQTKIRNCHNSVLHAMVIKLYKKPTIRHQQWWTTNRCERTLTGYCGKQDLRCSKSGNVSLKFSVRIWFGILQLRQSNIIWKLKWKQMDAARLSQPRKWGEYLFFKINFRAVFNWAQTAHFD